MRFLMRFTVISLSVLSCLYAAIHYVPEAYPTIQQGINISSNGDTVLVQPGTYTENVVINNLAITLASNFLFTNDPDDITETIIDGGQTGSAVEIINLEYESTILTGFTLTNGTGHEYYEEGYDWYGNWYSFYDYYGGGLYIHQAHPIISNTIVEGNTAEFGGGIYAKYADGLYMDHVLVRSNTADGYGGGLFLLQADAWIQNSTISENGMISGGSGGGIHSMSSDIILNTVDVDSNSASEGGGLYLFDTDAELSFVNILSNTALTGGAPNGGGIRCGSSSSLHVEQSIISGNSAGNMGGGILLHGVSEADFEHVLIADNTAYSGAGLANQFGSSPELDHVTIAGNQSDSEGGGMICTDSDPRFTNSIFYHNEPDQVKVNPNFGASSIFFDYSDVEDDFTFYDPELNGFVSFSNSLHLDPQFVDIENNDYHLSEESPCIDAGDPDSALDPDGSITDMGMYWSGQNLETVSFNIQSIDFDTMTLVVILTALIPINGIEFVIEGVNLEEIIVSPELAGYLDISFEDCNQVTGIFADDAYLLPGTYHLGVFQFSSFTANLVCLENAQVTTPDEEFIEVIETGDCVAFDQPCEFPGDFNEDGVINILDIVLFLGYFALLPGPCPSYFMCGDMNWDGSADIIDIIIMVQIILGDY